MAAEHVYSILESLFYGLWCVAQRFGELCSLLICELGRFDLSYELVDLVGCQVL